MTAADFARLNKDAEMLCFLEMLDIWPSSSSERVCSFDGFLQKRTRHSMTSSRIRIMPMSVNNINIRF
jgi:hypothetical protein